uniref:Jumonji domain containing 8 n=1 Tax=Varanus komodoensis TaxID=61221 RepID=A0A8D2L4N6_VARKO
MPVTSLSPRVALCAGCSAAQLWARVDPKLRAAALNEGRWILPSCSAGCGVWRAPLAEAAPPALQRGPESSISLAPPAPPPIPCREQSSGGKHGQRPRTLGAAAPRQRGTPRPGCVWGGREPGQGDRWPRSWPGRGGGGQRGPLSTACSVLQEFQAQCTKRKLLAAFGDRQVRLSTANTYSYRKVDLPFQEYVDQFLEPQDPDSLGSETLYFFGNNNFTEWGPLFQRYTPPPFRIPGMTVAYSFGIAGSGSGVPFHWHGPGFSEVIFGRKRWFLYPPEKTPEFHPNRTTLSWLLHTYPLLPPWERPVECTIHPGEVLYFPDRWWHATLNLDTSVFISTFLG